MEVEKLAQEYTTQLMDQLTNPGCKEVFRRNKLSKKLKEMMQKMHPNIQVGPIASDTFIDLFSTHIFDNICQAYFYNFYDVNTDNYPENYRYDLFVKSAQEFEQNLLRFRNT